MTTSSDSPVRTPVRGRIENAAVTLFRRHGFHNVTVEDLCRVAEVSPATFYRHYAAKEDVVVAYREDFAAALRRAVASVGPDVPRREHLPLFLSAFSRFLDSQQAVLIVQGELLDGQPSLLRRTVAVERELEEELAAALARLTGADEPDDAARLAAAVAMAVLRAAVCAWRAGDSPSVPAATERLLADLREVLGSVDR